MRILKTFADMEKAISDFQDFCFEHEYCENCLLYIPKVPNPVDGEHSDCCFFCASLGAKYAYPSKWYGPELLKVRLQEIPKEDDNNGNSDLP